MIDLELYDIEKDRTDLHNMASEHPDLVKEMTRKWNVWAKEARVIPKLDK